MVIKEDSVAIQKPPSETIAMSTNKSSDKKTIITQEIKFARALAGNDPTLRRRVLKNLRTWLTTRSQSTFAFSEADFLRLWKGLFYCMWMSDKPLVQEELAESLGLLVHCFDHNVPVAMQFFKTFLLTMGNEWFGIDRWRMDKFMMLVRRVTRQALVTLHETGWQSEDVQHFAQTLNDTILNRDSASFGLFNHFNDLILNEIAKVSDGEVPKHAVAQIAEVYVQSLLKADDPTVIDSIRKHIFHGLMQQSELGQTFEEKFEIWKSNNFVTDNINNVNFHVAGEDGEDDEEQEEVETGAEDEEEEEQPDENGEHQEGINEDVFDDEDSSNEEAEKMFDPRAGSVGVEIPEIEFDPLEMIALFEKYCYKPYVSTKSRKRGLQLVKQFRKFADGVYPLGVRHVPSVDPKHYAVNIDEKVVELESFHKELFGEKRKNMKERKKEKRYEKKLLRQQNESKKESQTSSKQDLVEDANLDNGCPPEGIDTMTSENGGSESAPEAPEKLGKKRTKRVRMNREKMKKQEKLQVLQRKREEKMKLLKERLKKKKQTKETEVSPDPSARSLADTVVKEKKAKSVPTTTNTVVTIGINGNAEVSPVKPALVRTKLQPKQKSSNDGKPFQTTDEWSEPLKEGEEEYFIPSRKSKSIVKVDKTPTKNAAKPSVASKPSLKRASLAAAVPDTEDPVTPARKRVKIALNKNVAQDILEHIKQVKNSPQLPFDSSKKPSKSLLKPNLIPSPINPFYKKKIGLK